MINYTIEKLADNLDIINKLSKLHHDEVAPFDDIPLSINWARFIKMEELGILKLFTVREENVLVGYASFIITKGLEYSNTVEASMNNIFIHPAYRGSGTKFISWCEKQVKELGADVIYHHVKAKNDYGVLLKRLGYDIININYAKRLDK